MQKNLSLFSNKSQKCFGGSGLTSHPKSKRPLSTKHAIHLVLKSQRARGVFSMLKGVRPQKIARLIRHHARQNQIDIKSLVNVGNHLHLILQLRLGNIRQAEISYKRFIRIITGLIARLVTKAERSRPLKESFWQARPFTRLLNWGRDYKNVRNFYMEKNRVQATGGIMDLLAFGFVTFNQDLRSG